MSDLLFVLNFLLKNKYFQALILDVQLVNNNIQYCRKRQPLAEFLGSSFFYIFSAVFCPYVTSLGA